MSDYLPHNQAALAIVKHRNSNEEDSDMDTVSFNIEKETKGAVRYKEEGERDDHKIGTLYIRKSAFGDEPFPASIKVTVEAA